MQQLSEGTLFIPMARDNAVLLDRADDQIYMKQR